MCTLKDPMAILFEAETRLWNIHAVVTLASEVCHAAMDSGKKELSLLTVRSEPWISNSVSVFATALGHAVDQLEQLYLLLDTLEPLPSANVPAASTRRTGTMGKPQAERSQPLADFPKGEDACVLVDQARAICQVLRIAANQTSEELRHEIIYDTMLTVDDLLRSARAMLGRQPR